MTPWCWHSRRATRRVPAGSTRRSRCSGAPCRRGPLSVTMRRNLAVWLFMAGQLRGCPGRTRGIARHQQARRCAGRSHWPVGAAGRVTTRPHSTTASDAGGAGTGTDTGLGVLRAGSQGGIRRGIAADLRRACPTRMAYKVAEVHAYRGENDAAFEWLRRFAAADPAGLQRRGMLARRLGAIPAAAAATAAGPALAAGNGPRPASPVIKQARR